MQREEEVVVLGVMCLHTFIHQTQCEATGDLFGLVPTIEERLVASETPNFFVCDVRV